MNASVAILPFLTFAFELYVHIPCHHIQPISKTILYQYPQHLASPHWAKRMFEIEVKTSNMTIYRYYYIDAIAFFRYRYRLLFAIAVAFFSLSFFFLQSPFFRYLLFFSITFFLLLPWIYYNIYRFVSRSNSTNHQIATLNHMTALTPHAKLTLLDYHIFSLI